MVTTRQESGQGAGRENCHSADTAVVCLRQSRGAWGSREGTGLASVHSSQSWEDADPWKSSGFLPEPKGQEVRSKG